MAVNDLKVVNDRYSVLTFSTDDRDTSGASATLKPGEPVKKGGATSDFVMLLADGEPTQISAIFVGIVDTESTEAAAAEGECKVKVVEGGTHIEGKAKTSTTVDTQAEINDLKMNYVVFDHTSGAYTIDAAATDDADANGLVILYGDPIKTTLVVGVHAGVTLYGTRSVAL